MGKKTSTVKFAVLLLGLCLTTAACKGKGGTLVLSAQNNSATDANKPLFSVWNEANGFYSVDLRQANYGVTSPASFTAITGQNCTCQVLIQGSEQSGNFTFSNCTGANAAQCTTYQGTTTYTRNAGTLNVCSAPSSCTSLR